MLFVLTLSTTYYYKYFLLITRVHIKGNYVLRPSRLLDFSDAHPQTMPTTQARVIRPLFLPRGGQIEIEYNPHRPSIRTIVRQVETLGYWVSVRPYQGQQEIINQGFTSQCVGHVHIDSVDVEVTEDFLK